MKNKLSRSRYYIFATVACALLLSSIDGTVVAVALPVFTSFFHTSLIVAGWIISIYQLALTATLPLAGKVSDIMGRKSTFMICVALFTFGSLLCSVAPDIGLLIFFRFIQALGGAGIFPAATAIVADEFPDSRQRAIGLFSSIFPIGWIIGPNLGAWLITSLGWRSLFWINIPIGLIVIFASNSLLRKDVRKKGVVDFTGAALVGISLSTLMAGLSIIGNSQTNATWIVAGVLFCSTFICAALLVRHEIKSKDPILDIEILKGKPFVAANIYNVIYGAAILGIMSLIPTFAVSVYGMSTFESGFILTPRSIGMIAASLVASHFIVRWGYRWPMILGTSALAISFILLGLEPIGITVLGRELDNLTIMGIMVFFLGIGTGIVSPAANNACIELMPERIASITGIRGMFRQTGGAVGITIATLLLHVIGNMTKGFSIICWGLSIALLASISVIFAMPSCPKSKASSGEGDF